MFIRMYNYLKVNNNSSSFNFRNLFFTERATKFRRIMSNVGATFRNSKWTDYSLNNVNRLQHSFEPNYIFSFFGFTALFTLSYTLVAREFPMLDPLVEFSIFNLLDHLDTFFSFTEVWSTITPVLLQFFIWFGFNQLAISILNLITNTSSKSSGAFHWNDFIGRKFLATTSFIDYFKQNIPYRNTKDGLKISTQFSSTNNPNFEVTVNSQLYRVGNNSVNVSRPLISRLSAVEVSNLLVPTSPANVEGLTESHPSIYTLKSSLSDPSVSTQGSFYTQSLGFQNLMYLTTHSELLNLSSNLSTRDQMINTLRWSYRYNSLHRRTMYNSHKLTEVKTLISAGYFDLSSTTNNIWFSDQYARNLDFGKKNKALTSINLLKTNWNLLYKSSFGYNNLTGAFSTSHLLTSQDTFHRLSFYESSFHFFINRSKFFASLRSNALTSLPQQKQLFNQNWREVTSALDIYKHSLNLSLRLLDEGSKDLSPKSFVLKPLDNVSYTLTGAANKDITVIKKDRDLLYLKTLVILYNITKTNSSNPNNIYAYLYLDTKVNAGYEPAPIKLVRGVKSINIFKH
jgi:hypothetical protein